MLKEEAQDPMQRTKVQIEDFDGVYIFFSLEFRIADSCSESSQLLLPSFLTRCNWMLS